MGIGLIQIFKFYLEIQLQRLIKLLKLGLLPLQRSELKIIGKHSKTFLLKVTNLSKRKNRPEIVFQSSRRIGISVAQHHKIAYVVIATTEFMRSQSPPQQLVTYEEG